MKRELAALGAYVFARRLTRLDVSAARGHRLFSILERQGDFFTLCALRVLPGMPHSAINYAAGTLALPLPRFLAATALGLAFKSHLYSARRTSCASTSSARSSPSPFSFSSAASRTAASAERQDRFRPIVLKNSKSQARQNSVGYRGNQKFD